MRSRSHGFLPRVEKFDLRILPGQLLGGAEAGRWGPPHFLLEPPTDSRHLALLADDGADTAGQTTDVAPAGLIAPLANPRAETTRVLARHHMARDLGEAPDLLENLLAGDLEADDPTEAAASSNAPEQSPPGSMGTASTSETTLTETVNAASASAGGAVLLPPPGQACADLAHGSCGHLQSAVSQAAPQASSGCSASACHGCGKHLPGASCTTVHTAATSADLQLAGSPGGTRGDPSIHTPHDEVPNFGAHPTVVSVRSGNWSNPATWSTGQRPAAGDIVAISPSTTVTYDVVSNAALNTLVVQAGGRLNFKTTVNTRVMVGNFLVHEGGRLDVGTATNPVLANVKAEIVIADQALDTQFDPKQYGTGLLAWGKVTMHGAVKAPTFARLAVEPHLGDTTLTFTEPVTGWRPGDQLIVPPTTAVYFTDLLAAGEFETEEMTVRAVSGNVVTLTAPLANDHLGAYDAAGELTFLSHVGNLTRNVVIRSENPEGTRGHTMFTHRADVDLRYVQFKDLGRTNGGELDNTILDANGTPVHIGTNQIGRYALHAHLLWGPVNALDQGYQYELVGNVIDGGRKWGMAFHGSHYGLIQDNIVFDLQEAGIATEDGTESFNEFVHNFVVRVGGDQYDFADGFWIGGPRNYFRDNVVASAFNSNHSDLVNTGTGFHLDGLRGPINSGYSSFPLRRGADMTNPNETEVLELTRLPMLEFSGNEGYAMDYVFWNDHHVGPSAADGGHHITDLRAWAVWNGAANAYGGAMTFDGVTVRKFGRAGFLQQSAAGLILLRNADIQEANPGVMGIFYMAGAGADFELHVENAYLRTAQNVVITLAHASGRFVDSSLAKRTVLRNVIFDAPVGLPYQSIVLSPTMEGKDSVVPVLSNTVYVADYNGRRGDNFQVFFREQHPDFIVPYEGDLPEYENTVRYSVPERGLTNTDAWGLYHLAMAGGIAPCTDDTTRPEIDGFAC